MRAQAYQSIMNVPDRGILSSNRKRCSFFRYAALPHKVKHSANQRIGIEQMGDID